MGILFASVELADQAAALAGDGVGGGDPDGGPGGGFRRRDDGVVDADYEDVTPEKETDDDSDSDRQIPR